MSSRHVQSVIAIDAIPFSHLNLCEQLSPLPLHRELLKVIVNCMRKSVRSAVIYLEILEHYPMLAVCFSIHSCALKLLSGEVPA